MAFNKSDYKLKYSKQLQDINCNPVNIDIFEKTDQEIPRPKYIHAISSISLEVEGRSEDIACPIVKSSLNFTIIDCSDMADTENEKFGGWQEFYTPDDTKYLVEVSTWKKYDDDFELRWRGYITPDSWRETLDYRGSITITARDGIGALDNIPFEASRIEINGMVKVIDIIKEAENVGNIPMRILMGGPEYPQELEDAEGHTLYDLEMNVSAFEGCSWYEALEMALDSTGMVLRYNDIGVLEVCAIRYLSSLGYGDMEDPRHHSESAIFMGGTKILEPAYKRIVETIDFGYKGELNFETSDQEMAFSGAETPAYLCQHNRMTEEGAQGDINNAPSQIHTSFDYGNPAEWHTENYPALLDVSRYDIDPRAFREEGDGVNEYMYIAANAIGTTRPVIFKKGFSSSYCKIRLDFAPTPGSVFNKSKQNDWSGKEGGLLATIPEYSLLSLTYSIQYQDAFLDADVKIRRSWNGKEWTVAPKILTKEWKIGEYPGSLEVSLSDCSEINGNGVIVFRIIGAYFGQTSERFFNAFSEMHRGIFLRLKSISFASMLSKHVGSHTTTTNNHLNTACNVKLERSPKFGMLPCAVGMLSPSVYKYAFFLTDKNGLIKQAPYLWGPGGVNLQPFPAQIAKQLLCHHADSESLLEGDFVSGNPAKPLRFTDVYLYKGTMYKLQSATLDFIDNRFVSATLRSFKDYYDLFPNNT